MTASSGAEPTATVVPLTPKPAHQRSADPGLVELLVSQPHMIERLALRHDDDGHGRCRRCSAGAQTGRYRFPCQIRLAVDEACGRLVARRLRPAVPGGALDQALDAVEGRSDG